MTITIKRDDAVEKKYKYTYTAKAKDSDVTFIADSAAALGTMLGISMHAVADRVRGRSDQSRSQFVITREPAKSEPISDSKNEGAKKFASDGVEKSAFATLCKAVRKHMGINQADLANILFSTAHEVSLMEHGYIPRDDRKVKKIKKIARKIGII